MCHLSSKKDSCFKKIPGLFLSGHQYLNPGKKSRNQGPESCAQLSTDAPHAPQRVASGRNGKRHCPQYLRESNSISVSAAPHRLQKLSHSGVYAEQLGHTIIGPESMAGKGYAVPSFLIRLHVTQAINSSNGTRLNLAYPGDSATRKL